MLGACQIGATTQRIVEVTNGRLLGAIWSSLIISMAYYIGITFIVNKDLIGYIGYSIGATFITAYMAHMNKKKIPTKMSSNS